MAKKNDNIPGRRAPKVTSIGNPRKKHVRDNSKDGQRNKKGRP